MSHCEYLPGILDRFDAVELSALAVLALTLILVSMGGLDTETGIVRMIIYACVATLFGSKFAKGRKKGE